MKRVLVHIIISIAAMTVLVVLPLAFNNEIFSGSGTDAVTGATVELPDKPSGDYVILINTRLHEDSIADWESFFTDRDFAVIFDDIKCITAKGDVSGKQLAERYMAQLPENQMTLRTEDPTLLISKAETGHIDTAIFSGEMADALKLAPIEKLDGITLIKIHGGESGDEKA